MSDSIVRGQVLRNGDVSFSWDFKLTGLPAHRPRHLTTKDFVPPVSWPGLSTVHTGTEPNPENQRR